MLLDLIAFRLEQVFATYLAISLLVALVFVTPLCIWAMRPRATKRRKAFALGTGYLITMAILGVYAYVVLPVEYTRDLNLNWPPPSATSLLAKEFELQSQIAYPDARSTPQVADDLRAAMNFQRLQFVLCWAALTLALASPVILLRRLRRIT